MASWAAVLALSGFHYSGVEKSIAFAPQHGMHFWSNGSAWGTCSIQRDGEIYKAELTVKHGGLDIRIFRLGRL